MLKKLLAAALAVGGLALGLVTLIWLPATEPEHPVTVATLDNLIRAMNLAVIAIAASAVVRTAWMGSDFFLSMIEACGRCAKCLAVLAIFWLVVRYTGDALVNAASKYPEHAASVAITASLTMMALWLSRHALGQQQPGDYTDIPKASVLRQATEPHVRAEQHRCAVHETGH